MILIAKIIVTKESFVMTKAQDFHSGGVMYMGYSMITGPLEAGNNP